MSWATVGNFLVFKLKRSGISMKNSCERRLRVQNPHTWWDVMIYFDSKTSLRTNLRGEIICWIHRRHNLSNYLSPWITEKIFFRQIQEWRISALFLNWQGKILVPRYWLLHPPILENNTSLFQTVVSKSVLVHRWTLNLNSYLSAQ